MNIAPGNSLHTSGIHENQPGVTWKERRGRLLSACTLMLLTLGSIVMPQTAYAENKPILSHTMFGSGPEKVLVLHSWIDNASSFDGVKPFLDTEAFTFVFADLRGYGGSRHIAGQYTAKETAEDAIRLADALGWDRFHVIGHSMSGMIVQRLAVTDWTSGAKRLKSVIAVTPVTADGYPADEETKTFLLGSIHHPELATQLVAGLTGGRLPAAFYRSVMEKNIATSRADAMQGYYEMWVHTDFSAEAKAAQVGTPIRVIGGRQDLPGFQEEKYRATFSAWYPNADLQFITDAGHLPMYETPLYFAALVEEFLKAYSGQ